MIFEGQAKVKERTLLKLLLYGLTNFQVESKENREKFTKKLLRLEEMVSEPLQLRNRKISTANGKKESSLKNRKSIQNGMLQAYWLSLIWRFTNAWQKWQSTKDLATKYSEHINDADGFAQVFPEHKFLIVECFRQLGYKCGMTADRVNDAPALKKADVGIAVQILPVLLLPLSSLRKDWKRS
jgi:hypothetical protein